jgi:iron complex transport system ATP-binding protein
MAAMSDASATCLECRGVTVSVPARELVSDLTAEFRPGTILAILCRNGAGKSSLLHVLAGLRAPAAGEVRLRGRPIVQWPRREFAAQVGLLPQASEDPFPGTVLETVLVGRHPHIDFWRWEDEEDLDVARRCLRQMDLAGLEGRDVGSLSGGERRRLAVAAVLAQEPQTYLLDEPVQQLDPRHELQVLELFRALADAGRTVIMSLHDAGLAARFADEALLLYGDGRWLHGTAGDALNEQTIASLYGVDVRELRWDGGRTFVPV